MTPNKNRSKALLCALPVLALATPVHASEGIVEIPTAQKTHRVVLVASADADVQGGAPNVNYGDDPHVHVGLKDKSAFVRFTLKNRIPKNATIKSATLIMTAVGTGDAANKVKLGFARQEWSEKGITFANQPNVEWTTQTRKIAAGSHRFGVKDRVVAWVSGRLRNHGFALTSIEGGPIWAFVAKEGAPTESRPKLSIVYTTTVGKIEPPLAAKSGRR